MLEKLNIEDFQKWVNLKFKLKLDSGRALELELVRVTKATERELGEEERTPFSAEFLGPESPVLPQSIYPLENDAAGKLDLFLVPVGPESGGMIYEAVFT